jgi:hypothetical protein
MKLLWAYWNISAEEGHPLQDILFRPMRRDGKGFTEAQASSSAYYQRLKKVSADAGVAYQATPHGGRRGAVQHAVSQGATDEDIGALARIKTPKIRKVYMDPTRHEGGALKRVRRGEYS